MNIAIVTCVLIVKRYSNKICDFIFKDTYSLISFLSTSKKEWIKITTCNHVYKIIVHYNFIYNTNVFNMKHDL